MYDVPVRLAEMDKGDVQVHAVSLPPFLFCTTADDEAFATGIVAQGNDELAQYVAGAPDRLLGLGMSRSAGRASPTRPGGCWTSSAWPASPIGSQGGGKDLDDPVNDDLWALLSERGHLHLHAPQRDARRRRG